MKGCVHAIMSSHGCDPMDVHIIPSYGCGLVST
jgi:hypothetical protein